MLSEDFITFKHRFRSRSKANNCSAWLDISYERRYCRLWWEWWWCFQKKKKNQQKRIEINIAVNLFLWLHLENQIENKKEKNKNLINPGSRIVSNRCVCLQNYTSTLYLPFFFSSCFVPKRFINFENGEKFWRIHGRENRGKDLMQMKRRSSNPKP